MQRTVLCPQFAITFALFVAVCTSAQGTDIIRTIAGGGSLEGYSPDEADLSLGASQGLAISALAEIYFSDSGHNQVMKVNPTTGLISVVAGNGTRAYNGDGLPAVSAGLNNPGGLAFDSAGNLFICDRGNFVVRRVDALSGLISTAAGVGLFTGQVVGTNPPAPLGDGGAATAATFSTTLGDIFVDSTGNVTVCDSGNACVRQFTVGGNIATIAGVPGSSGFSGDGNAGGALAAKFNTPTGVVADGSGNLYIADSGNRRVRKLSGGTVTTVAGDGTGGSGGFSGDGGAATSAQIGSLGGLALDSSGKLVISCVGPGRIRTVDVADAAPIILTIAGNGGTTIGDDGPATGASLSSPRDVALDSLGNIYIYDSGHDRIRRVDKTTGFIDTVVGTGLNGFIGDRGPQQDGVLVAPQGSAFDAAGNLYVADTGDNAVRRVSSDGKITTFAGNGTTADLGDGGPAFLASLTPNDVCVFGTTLFIADADNQSIRAVDLGTGIIRTYAQLNSSPVCVIADPNGILYVARSNVIETVDLTGTVAPFAGQSPVNNATNPNGDGLPAANARLRSPSGLALDSAGELLIADTNNNLIRKIGAPPGLLVSTIAGGGTPTPPSIGDGGPAQSASLNSPAGVAVDATRILISDTGDQVIRSIDIASGNISTICGNGTPGFVGDGDLAVNAEVNSPGRMIFHAASLVFADVNNNRIRSIEPGIDIDPTTLSFSAKFDFAIDKKTGLITNGRDSASLKASLALPAGINPDNLIIRVDVIDLHQQIQLDATGKIPKAVKLPKTTTTTTVFDFTLPAPPPPPVSKFSLGLKQTSAAGDKPVSFSFSTNGTLREELGRAGFTDVTTASTGVMLPVRVNITLGTTTFTGVTTVLYQATQGKSGTAKTVKSK